jgi:hypothetical protein
VQKAATAVAWRYVSRDLRYPWPCQLGGNTPRQVNAPGQRRSTRGAAAWLSHGVVLVLIRIEIHLPIDNLLAQCQYGLVSRERDRKERRKMATEKQLNYIMSLLRAKSELFASTGVVTFPMFERGLASRKEVGLPLSVWAGKLDKSEASWVIGKLAA